VEEALERAFMMVVKNKGICGTTADATRSKFCEMFWKMRGEK
jgi:hypothetical protein